MARYTGPKVKLSRRVGVPIADIPKHTAKELELPGMHGYRGRRNTEYGVRLHGKAEASLSLWRARKAVPPLHGHGQEVQGKHRPVDDPDCSKRGWTTSFAAWASGGRSGRPARSWRTGTSWSTAARPTSPATSSSRARRSPSRKEFTNFFAITWNKTPATTFLEWLEWNPAQLTAKINAKPTPEDVPFEVNMNLIIEFYR